jgi:hypothetical protein
LSLARHWRGEILKYDPERRGRCRAYSSAAVFRVIKPGSGEGSLRMNSQSVAGILGAIVASIVLVAAVVYGPMGQFGKPVKPVSVQPATAQPAPAAPVPRGPVIREVPNNQ